MVLVLGGRCGAALRSPGSGWPLDPGLSEEKHFSACWPQTIAFMPYSVFMVFLTAFLSVCFPIKNWQGPKLYQMPETSDIRNNISDFRLPRCYISLWRMEITTALAGQGKSHAKGVWDTVIWLNFRIFKSIRAALAAVSAVLADFKKVYFLRMAKLLV